MDDRSPAFQLYPADFLTDENVVLMTLDEKGAYILLICFCWREGSIPNDLTKLSRLCGCSVEKMETMWESIKNCFKICKKNDARLIHPRLEKEKEKQKNFAKKASERGKKGAETRWNKGKQPDASSNALSIDQAMQKNSFSSSSSISSSEEHPLPPAGECVSELPKFSKEVEDGALYFRNSGNPNLSNASWVPGYLQTVFSEIRKDGAITPAQFLEAWRETCDDASSRAVSAAKWYKTAFESRLKQPKNNGNFNQTIPAKPKPPGKGDRIREAFKQGKLLVLPSTGRIFSPNELTPVDAAYQPVDISKAIGLRPGLEDYIEFRFLEISA